MLKLGRLSLSLCAVAWMTTACSNEPLQPSGALWPSGSKAHAGASGSGGGSRKSALTAAARERSGPGWGLYSGERGQAVPPPAQNYVFRGDPNAGTTFAPTQPAQM
jgi:hypothetical protein